MAERRAVVYCRVSSTMQERDGVSLDAQLDLAREYCERKGWSLVERYVDVMSGTSDKRPDLSRLERDAQARRFEVVICYKLDRLSRNVGHFHEILAALEAARVDLVSLTQEIDTSTASGRLLLNILISVAQNESETISERVSMAKRYAASRGDWTITRPPFGYRFVSAVRDESGRKQPARLVVNEPEADLVRSIFDLYLELGSVMAVCRRLNADGYRTPRGAAWQTGTVTRLLQNPLYRGDLVFGREVTQRRARKRHRNAQPRSRWIVHEGAAPALVSPEVAAAVAAQLKENASRAPRATHARMSRPWSDLLRCAGCDGSLWFHSTGPAGDRFGAYGCFSGGHMGEVACRVRARISEVQLGELVLPAIAEAFDRASVMEHAGTGRAARKPAGRRRPDRARLLAELAAKKQRVLEARLDGYIPDKADFEARMAEIDAAIAAVPAEPQEEALPPLPKLPATLLETWHRLGSDRDRGRLLRALVDRIIVTGDAAIVHLTAFDHPEWPDEPLTVAKRRVRRASRENA